MSAEQNGGPDPERTMGAALVELATAFVLLHQVVELAEDWASPRYKPDIGERQVMVQRLEQLHAWQGTHPTLVRWAKRTGAGPAARVLKLI